MKKRVIFSLYRDDLLPHQSATIEKREQFAKYADQIKKKQEAYAKTCKADYKLIKPTDTDYNVVQFEKLTLFEELAQEYDEILYLDYDVIPIRKKNFFTTFDLNNICAFDMVCKLEPDIIRWRDNNDGWHPMDMYSKAQHKRSMMMLNDDFGSNMCLNTGVVGMNKQMVKKLDLVNKMDYLRELSLEAKEDNIYHDVMTKHWIFNNEVALSYLIEMEGLPFINIGVPWNFIVDDNIPATTGACYFLHFVHKKFEMYFT